MSTKSNANLKPIELTPSELDSVAGGFARREDAMAWLQMAMALMRRIPTTST
jgi:hypothetical protein